MVVVVLMGRWGGSIMAVLVPGTTAAVDAAVAVVTVAPGLRSGGCALHPKKAVGHPPPREHPRYHCRHRRRVATTPRRRWQTAETRVHPLRVVNRATSAAAMGVAPPSVPLAVAAASPAPAAPPAPVAVSAAWLPHTEMQTTAATAATAKTADKGCVWSCSCWKVVIHPTRTPAKNQNKRRKMPTKG